MHLFLLLVLSVFYIFLQFCDEVIHIKGILMALFINPSFLIIIKYIFTQKYTLTQSLIYLPLMQIIQFSHLLTYVCSPFSIYSSILISVCLYIYISGRQNFWYLGLDIDWNNLSTMGIWPNRCNQPDIISFSWILGTWDLERKSD